MFATTKPKAFHAPGAKSQNSRNNFVDALNQSFDTAEKLLQRNGKFKQTKLCLGEFAKKPKLESAECTMKAKPQFFMLPVPQQQQQPQADKKINKLNKTVGALPCALHTEVDNEPQPKPSNAIMQKNGRSQLALLGQVDFCLKMHKVYADVQALWTVYGKLQKTVKGKQRGELILLLRNASGGPILQSIYYDFEDILKEFELGCFVRAVGNFIGENRLRTFKVEKITDFDLELWRPHFTRIQNVSSFALLQNNMQEKAK